MHHEYAERLASLEIIANGRTCARARYNEVVREISAFGPDTLCVTYETRYGVESDAHVRIVRLERVVVDLESIKWRVKGELKIPTPGVLTSRRGAGHSDNPYVDVSTST